MFNPMHSRTQSTLSSFCCKSLECPRTELQLTLTPFVHVSEKPQKILYFHFRFLRFDITLHVYDDSWMTVENKVYETVKIYWDCAFCGLLKIYRLHIEVWCSYHVRNGRQFYKLLGHSVCKYDYPYVFVLFAWWFIPRRIHEFINIMVVYKRQPKARETTTIRRFLSGLPSIIRPERWACVRTKTHRGHFGKTLLEHFDMLRRYASQARRLLTHVLHKISNKTYTAQPENIHTVWDRITYSIKSRPKVAKVFTEHSTVCTIRVTSLDLKLIILRDEINDWRTLHTNSHMQACIQECLA